MVANKARKQKSGGFWRGFIIFLSGVACGTGVIAGVASYINGLHLPFIKEQEQTHLPSLSGRGEERGRREAVEFQDILRQQQPLPAVQEPAPAADAAAPRRFDYYLQIGAFRNKSVAEDLRGRIILDGLTARINTGTLADGSVLYRVWTGPYESEDAAEQARANLALGGYADVQLLQTAR